MNINESLKKIKKIIDDTKTSSDFKKKKNFDEWKKKYSFELIKCGGELEVCKVNFERIISSVCTSLKKAREEGHFTGILEEELRKSVVGYLIVDECEFALSTVNDYDSINMVYEMIDLAGARLLGKNAKPKLNTLFRHPERSAYSYIYGDEEERKRNDMFDAIKEDVIRTGNISRCLADYRQNESNSTVDKMENDDFKHGKFINKKNSFNDYRPIMPEDIEMKNKYIENSQIETEPPIFEDVVNGENE